MKRIPVYDQLVTEEDAVAAYNAVKTGTLSWFGVENSNLRKDLSDYFNIKHVMTCSSGTTGLILALSNYQPYKNLTVAVPTCSYAATAFSVINSNINNEIVFIDADINTWNLDLDSLENVCKSRRIDVVLAVHNYGNPVDMHKLTDLSKRYEFSIIEDACEAMGAEFDGKKIGSIGDVGVFSGYGNKYVSSGEGGIVITNDDNKFNIMDAMNSQGQSKDRKFWHEVVGHNFRMSHVQAAIFRSQFSRLDKTMERKMQIAELYKQHLNSDLIWQTVPEGGKHCYWMVCVRHWLDINWYDRLSKILESNNIESRPVFPQIHTMPAMSDMMWSTDASGYNNAETLYRNGICLPSGPATTDEEILRVCEVVNSAI